MRSLAHEWGHWLDHEAGTETRDGHEFYTNGRTQRKVKAFKTGLSKTDYTNPLIRKATDNMNDRWAIRKLQNPPNNRELTKEEKNQVKEMRARIGTYYEDPREVWARLTEQYVAEHHGKATVASEKPGYYENHPAYWNKENFEEMKPMIKAEMDRRIAIARGTT
jgi:hypothetical protein